MVAFAAPPLSPPSYSSLVDKWDRWHDENPALVTVHEYGRSVLGLPLRLIVVKKDGNFNRRPTLVMSGVTHGNEYLGVEDRLPEVLIHQGASSARGTAVARFLDSGGALVFIPVLNPDGFQAGKRENAHHVDLNRDWDDPPAHYQSFKEVETRALADMLETLHRGPENLDYRITVDYHCCGGALLYPWGYTDIRMPDADLERHRSLAQLAARRLDLETGVTHDLLGYHDIGTTKDYYYSHYGAAAFTYEGRPGQEANLLQGHVQWWADMMATFLSGTAPAVLTVRPDKQTPFLRLAD
jgi:predicted deacylase